MNSKFFRPPFNRCGWRIVAPLFLFLAGGGVLSAAGEEARPQITSIQTVRSNVMVTVFVPPGLRVITLEGRSHPLAGAWEPVAVQHLDGQGGWISLRFGPTAPMQLLRVRAAASSPLPETFYGGARSFTGRKVVDSSDGNGMVWALNAAGVATGVPSAVPGTTVTPTDTSAPADARVVEESDIWKLRGNTLYYFNQYRGLQVIDLANPDAPVVRGLYSLPTVGEEMYLLDDDTAVLLARTDCAWNADQGQSSILLVDVHAQPPVRRATLNVPGRITESRLVGQAFYVASETWRPRTNQNGVVEWEQGTHITSFDFANPAAPRERSALWYPGSRNVISATDHFLFVAVPRADGWDSDVHCLDISAANGTIVPGGTVLAGGQVNDKFKIYQHDDVLTVVAWGRNAASVLVTKVRTFSLAHPGAPSQLGELQLGANEQLFATRFDGTRLYAVTYRRIDPLWVIDLSVPTQPRLAGELQVPGWSTFIQPWGDRLVTVGIDDTNGNRVAAQLFDVGDPAHPSLLSKVSLGENYSWSEANVNEKAVQILPEAGLILLPYQGWVTNSYASRVQLIDLTRQGLTRRGFIEHQFSPRRALAQGDRIYSISGRELLSVDATDRSAPQVRASLELAWDVDQVFVQGEYLLELSRNEAIVRVARADLPDAVLASYRLPDRSPVVGAAVQGSKLYLAQQQNYYGPYYLLAATSAGGGEAANTSSFRLSILDLNALPALPIMGVALAATEPTSASEFQAVWPRPDLLVWVGQQSPFLTWWPYGPVYAYAAPVRFDTLSAQPATPLVGAAVATASLSFGPTLWWPSPRWFPRSSEQWSLAFDVGNPGAPEFRSALNLGTNGGYNFSSAFAAEGMIYQSHQRDDRIVTGTNYYVWNSPVQILETNYFALTNITAVIVISASTNLTLQPGSTSRFVRSQWPTGTRFSAGGYHNLALLPDGNAWSWGLNTAGQLGDGTFRTRSEPQAIGSDMTALNAGLFHSLGLKTDGTILAWGSDLYGQIGDGSDNSTPVSGPPLPPLRGVALPAPVPGLSSVRGLAGGASHTLALLTDGTVWAWGDNSHGQLGDGTTQIRFLPGRLASLSNVIAIAAGDAHSLALLADGTIMSWGRNDFRPAGQGAPNDVLVPRRLSLTHIVALAGGGRHSLALQDNGSVWSWGGDDWEASQSAANSSPHPLAGLTNVVAIAAGNSHNVTLCSDGRVLAWGRNDFGQLGSVNPAFSSQPRQVSGLENAAAITAGAFHTVATRGDGITLSWGDNRLGQLGRGEPLMVTNNVLQPELVLVTNLSYVTNVTWQEKVNERWDYVSVTNAYDVITWLEKHYLDVVDYADRSHPTPRQPINLPGQLKGLAHQGALLYTIGTRDEETNSVASWLEASAYDEVSVSLVDSLRLPANGELPVLVSGGTAVVVRPQSGAVTLESWALSENTGRFTLKASHLLPATPQALFGFGMLLGAQIDRELRLLDLISLKELGVGPLLPCGGEDLIRADGDPTRGVWIPQGDFGVGHVTLEGK